MNDLDFEIVKTKVETKTRKLKASWTVGGFTPYTNRVHILPPDESGSAVFIHGVDLSEVNMSKLDEIVYWLHETFDRANFNTAGNFDDKVWFKNERDLTLFLMKWS